MTGETEDGYTLAMVEPITLTATQVQDGLGAALADATADRRIVVVTRYGTPRAVLIPLDSRGRPIEGWQASLATQENTPAAVEAAPGRGSAVKTGDAEREQE